MNTLLLSLCLSFAPQDPPKVDQKKVDEAIKKGVAFLKEEIPHLRPRDMNGRDMRYDELILWTFIHAGVSEEDEAFKTLFERVLKAKEEVTYRVALKAMILEEVDRVKYQPWIARCAQFLVDNQGEDGQWSYGEPSIAVDDIPTPSGGKDVATPGGEGPIVKRKKPDVKRRWPIKARRKGPRTGDNSNSQYAALGIRACADAGIVFDRDVLQRALRSWVDGQQKDGGWIYSGGRVVGPGPGDRDSYGSMTAGGVGSVIIYLHLQGQNWKADRRVAAGFRWLEANFSVEENPRKKQWYYYYMYALERAGIFAGTERIGKHVWYDEGAAVLLRRQQDDGSWSRRPPPNNGGNRPGPPPGDMIADTCFAILFLRRATRPFDDVATEDKKK
ncbi:MAG: hypothetical protein HYY17_12055 [Planctomycetes bacterium]|nr:hypothetical protein [Planctomycetota bacterium]